MDHSAVDTARATRGGSHLWLPRALGDAGVLLALVLDREAGHPDNCSATGRQLGVHRDTVRRLRDELVHRGLVVVVDGYLVATAEGCAVQRRGCDPLPRPLLRGRCDRPSLAQLRAAAVVYGDAVGWRADRRGCRSDAERAELAGVHRHTVVAARALLVARGLVAVEELRRGRADLRRARLTEDRSATHGRPMSDGRAEASAEHARRGRARLRRGAELVDSGGAELVDTPMQSPTGTIPLQAPPAPPKGFPKPFAQEGFDRQSEPATAVRVADPQQRRRRAPAPAGDVLRDLVPELPQARAAQAGRDAGGSAGAEAELRRLVQDPQAVPRLLRLPAPRAVAQVLVASQVLDQAPRLRDGLAVQVARVLAPVQVLALAIDVVLGRPRNVPAVLRQRLDRAVAGGGELLTRSRAAWPIGRFVEQLAGSAPKGAKPAPRTSPSQVLPAAPPLPPAPTSFDELLRGIGLGDLVARRTTA